MNAILARIKADSPQIFKNIRYFGYLVFILAGAIAGLAVSNPDLIAFLPKWVLQWSMLIAALSGTGLGAAVISHLPVKDNTTPPNP